MFLYPRRNKLDPTTLNLWDDPAYRICKKSHNAEVPLVMNPWFVSVYGLFAMCVDSIVVHTIFEVVMVQNVYLGFILAVFICSILDLSPLYGGALLKQLVKKGKKENIIPLIIVLLAFVVIYAPLCYLRSIYGEVLYGDSTPEMVNLLATEVAVEVSQTDPQKVRAMVLIMNLEPLGSSVLGLALAYVSAENDGVREAMLAKDEIELSYNKARLMTALSRLKKHAETGLENTRRYDHQKKLLKDAEVEARETLDKVQARMYLSEHLENPSFTSHISQSVSDAEQSASDRTYQTAS